MSLPTTDHDSPLYSLANPQYRYFSTGVLADNRQVILGLQFPDIVLLFFDSLGNLLETTTRCLSVTTRTIGEAGLTAAFQDAYKLELEQIQHQLGLRPSTIRVKRFFLPDLEIGIEDLPANYLAVLKSPHEYEEEEVNYIKADIERWKSKGCFVFHWGTDYWMDKDGNVIAS